MILQSRKWRLVIRMAALLLTSALMLLLAAPASYALQDDRPKTVTSLVQIFNKEQPLIDRFVSTTAVPDLTRTVATQSGDTTYYWIPLPYYDDQVVVRTEGADFVQAYRRATDLNLDSQPRPGNFYGKLTSMSGQSGSDQAIEALAHQGLVVDKDKALVLLQGEEPEAYRPVVPVVGLLAVVWALALVGLFNVLRRRNPRARRRRSH